MLYQEGGLYNEVMLGAGAGNVPVGFGPVDLNAYQNTVDNVILYWTMEPFTTGIDTQGWVWEVETSLKDDFSNALSYKSDLIPPDKYISGVVHRGMIVPAYPRNDGAALTMYWRVRVRMGENMVSEWSSASFSFFAAMQNTIRDASMTFLPDVLFNKGADSNIYKLHNSFAAELGLISDQAQFMYLDSLVQSARDTALVPNFGDLLQIVRPAAHGTVPAMSNIDYRSVLRAYMLNIRSAPSQDAVSKMIHAIYRVWPTYYSVDEERSDVIVPAASVADTPYYIYPKAIPPGDELAVYILDRQNLDFGTIIEIANMLSVSNRQILTDAWAQEIIKRMIQAHVPVYFRYI